VTARSTPSHHEARQDAACGIRRRAWRWAVHDVGLEQLVLAYMRHPETTALPRPALAAVLPDATEVSR
jgi:hypothetical protein